MKTNIVASGYSLKDFDFSTLEGHTIVLNHVWMYCPHDFIVGLDNPKTSEWGIKAGIDLTKLHTNEAHGFDKCTNWKKYGKGLNRNEGQISGEYNGSLFAAINIALNLGFKELHIYGADGKLIDGYMHFFDEKPLTGRDVLKKSDMFKKFNIYMSKIYTELRDDEKIILH